MNEITETGLRGIASRYMKTCAEQRQEIDVLEGRIMRLKFALVLAVVVFGITTWVMS